MSAALFVRRRLFLFGVLALSGLPSTIAFAAQPFLRMAESKPVTAGGLEFVAATQTEWPFPGEGGEWEIEVRLMISNPGEKDIVFPTFDTFRILLKDSNGREIKVAGARDATCLTRPVLISPGTSYCLARRAVLDWSAPPDVAPRFIYFDGTGTQSVARPFSKGKYELYFSIKTPSYSPTEKMQKDLPDDAVLWLGAVTTNGVKFNVVDQ